MRRTRGPNIHTQEKPSGLKAKLTWTQPDMGWTGCGRANVAPMCHYMSSRSSSDSSPSPSSSTVSSVGWMRVPATMLRGRCARTVRRATFFLKESLQVVPVKGSPAWYALSISDKQGCDCYSVGLPVRAQNQVLEVGLDVPQQAAGMRMHANAYECVRMHTNTCECIGMHANAYDCICVHK